MACERCAALEQALRDLRGEAVHQYSSSESISSPEQHYWWQLGWKAAFRHLLGYLDRLIGQNSVPTNSNGGKA